MSSTGTSNFQIRIEFGRLDTASAPAAGPAPEAGTPNIDPARNVLRLTRPVAEKVVEFDEPTARIEAEGWSRAADPDNCSPC